MRKKIVGIFVCMLLIAAAVLPVAGNVNIVKSSVEEQDSSGLVDYVNSEVITQMNYENSERGEDYYQDKTGDDVFIGRSGSYPPEYVGDRDITFYPFVINNQSVLFKGDIGSTPTWGSGARLMWIPEKRAFRAGYVSGYQWNSNNIGSYSMATGYSTTASGSASTAIGGYTTASGYSSIAMGYDTTANGDYSTAMGYDTTANGDYSTAMGYGTQACGESSTAMGYNSHACMNFTTAIGYGASAYEDYSTAIGYGALTYADKSIAIGHYSYTEGRCSISIGNRTSAYGDSSIAMGHISEAGGDYSTAMGSWTDASGKYSTAMGYYTRAYGEGATAMGNRTKAHEETSTAMGYYSEASGHTSTAMGYNSDASGNVSTAMGYSSEASGICSTSMGLATIASGHTSTAMGFATTASGDYSTAMGRTIKVIGENSVGIGLNYNNPSYTVSNDNVMSIMGGNVGIGTTSPSANIHIVQTSATDDPLLIEDTVGTDLLSINKDGNANIKGYVYSEAGRLYIGDTADILASPYTSGNFEVYSGDEGGFDFVADKDFRLRTLSSIDTIYADSYGNVGIGSTSPTGKLDVAGTAQMTGFKMPTGATDGYVLTSDGSGTGTWKEAAGGLGGSGTWGYITKFINPTTLGNSLIYESGGNISIGTLYPSEKLEVVGNIKATSYLGDGSNLTGIVTTETDPIFTVSPAFGISTGDISRWNTAFGWGDHASAGYDTSDDSWIGTGDIYTTSGNVGIGTSSPSFLLQVLGGSGIVAQFSGRVKGAQAVNDDEFVTKAQVKSVVTTNYTPTGTSDSNGELGDTAWDSSYFYVKTPDGWKRASLETWETPEKQSE